MIIEIKENKGGVIHAGRFEADVIHEYKDEIYIIKEGRRKTFKKCDIKDFSVSISS